jgi:hypothetical protein
LRLAPSDGAVLGSDLGRPAIVASDGVVSITASRRCGQLLKAGTGVGELIVPEQLEPLQAAVGVLGGERDTVQDDVTIA